jgi:plasmid stabilization system protein ParE
VVKIVWTEISIHDLKEIFEYIAEDSEKYASITSLKIYSRVQDIIGNPHIGRIVPELNKKISGKSSKVNTELFIK